MKEVVFLRACLKNVRFFLDMEETLSEDLLLRLCKYSTYETYPRFYRLYKTGFDFLFKLSLFKYIYLGDLGRKFYIILDGSVFIMTPEVQEASSHNSIVRTDDDNISEEELIEKIAYSQNPGFTIKKTLEKGDGFGEIALRTEGIRTASVICCEDTHFLSISASTYKEIIAAHYDKIYKEKMDFLKNVSIFRQWGLTLLH